MSHNVLQIKKYLTFLVKTRLLGPNNHYKSSKMQFFVYNQVTNNQRMQMQFWV